MSKPGYRSATESRYARILTARGWVRDGRDGWNHLRLVWPPSGAVVTLPGCGPDQLFAKAMKSAEKVEMMP